jgi:predicted negative regulator of RcsB-dependent stress response
MTRLLVELVIIAALIFVGWNTPYKDWTAQAYRNISFAFDSLGGSLQKNQDPSVKRY